MRGSAHKIASEVSEFLRSPIAEKPFVRSGASTILNPEATPPTWLSLALVASMPALQRERAAFTERLGHYLSLPTPKKAWALAIGKKKLKPTHILLGDPIECDAKGTPKDLPLALHFLEMMARIGALRGRRRSSSCSTGCRRTWTRPASGTRRGSAGSPRPRARRATTASRWSSRPRPRSGSRWT
ncbi:MAG: hypothetical protein IPK12_14220 [Gemmatimonadetes bacterium]|nr:hypothetical protein [Gemmatimonadota bacterium]